MKVGQYAPSILYVDCLLLPAVTVIWSVRTLCEQYAGCTPHASECCLTMTEIISTFLLLSVTILSVNDRKIGANKLAEEIQKEAVGVSFHPLSTHFLCITKKLPKNIDFLCPVPKYETETCRTQRGIVDTKNQLDITFCILYFSSNSCSTCFGQPCAHYQELTTAWCYSLVLVCAVAAGRLSRPVGR